MKNLLEKLDVLIKTWLWERQREKNRVIKTRSLFLEERLTFYPQESDYEYLIYQYCKKNTRDFSVFGKCTNIHPCVFRLYMKNGEILLGFPIQLSNNLLTLRKEKSEMDGYHTALTEVFNIYLYEVEHISAIYDSDDFHAVYVKEPILGYKSIPEVDGKLFTKEHTYEINEQNIVDIRNPYNTDYQDCYLHFCTSMEGVALCPGPTHYLSSIKDYVEGHGVTRLFRVKAEGHCVNIDGDWWVTNTLTVLEEVSKNEIYEYYMENTKARERVSEHYNLSPDFWKEFLKSEITPYVKNE